MSGEPFPPPLYSFDVLRTFPGEPLDESEAVQLRAPSGRHAATQFLERLRAEFESLTVVDVVVRRSGRSGPWIPYQVEARAVWVYRARYMRLSG